MIDINLIRENPTLVKENMKKKFQDENVGLVDEAYKLDKDYREVVTRASEIRSLRNNYSKEIGALMREGKRDEAEEIKAKVTSMAEELKDLEVKEEEYGKELKNKWGIPESYEGIGHCILGYRDEELGKRAERTSKVVYA